MAKHEAAITWRRETPSFTYETYSRDHTWTFPGGATVAASAAPAYRGSPERVDPEEALVAALSSCHMLSFLALAAKLGHTVDAYEDRAEGTLAPNAERKLAVTRVVLRPRVTFAGEPPDAATLARLHEKAHEVCFIANSVKTEVVVEPR